MNDDATPDELREILRRLEAGDDDARRLAAQIADEQLLAGWFGAEADREFVDEAAAALRTAPRDPVFLDRTLQRIDRSRRARDRAATPGPTPALLAALAAGVLVVIGLIYWSVSTPPPVVSKRPLPAPEPLPPSPAPEPRIKPAPPPAPPKVDPAPLPPPKSVVPAPAPEPPAPKPPEPAPLPPPPLPRETVVAAIVRLERVEGRVTLVAPEGRVDAAAGTDLPGGRGLETDRTGRASLRFPDGTTLDLGPATKVEDIVDGAGKRMRLQSGSLSAVVAKQPADRPFVVLTPHGEAHVVGTKLKLAVDAAGTRLEVTEGKVRLTRTDKKSVEVAAGQAAVASPGLDLAPRPIEGFTIKDIPAQGLALWLRADSGVTLAAGAVSQWTDQSGSRREAVQEAAGRRPLLVADAARGRPALRFDGVDDGLVASLPIEGLGGLTLAIVAANAVDATGGPMHGENAALFWPETADWGWVYLSPFQSNVRFRFGTTQPNNLPFHIRAASTGGAFTLTISVKEGPVESLYVQGAPVERFAGKAPAVKGTQPALQIGMGASAKGFAGDIAEVLVYTRALSDPERQRLERALLSKYFEKK